MDMSHRTVALLLADAAADRCALYGCMVKWGEVLYRTERGGGPKKEGRVDAISEELSTEWVNTVRALTGEAARLKADGGLAYADCHAPGLARHREVEPVIDDSEFEAVTDQVDVRWLTSG